MLQKHVNYSFFIVLLVFPASYLIDNYLSDAFSHICNIFSDLPTVAAFKVSHLQYNVRPCDPIAGLLGSKCTLQRVTVSGFVCQRSSRYNWSAITVESKIKSNLQFIYFLSLQVLSIYWICSLAHESGEEGGRACQLVCQKHFTAGNDW